MTEYELTYLISELSNTVNVAFEFWLTATFSVLVTTFFAAEKINHKFLTIISLLYVLYATVSFLTYIWGIIRITGYVNKIKELGGDTADITHPLGWISLLLLIAVYIIGTIATLYFVNRSIRETDSE